MTTMTNYETVMAALQSRLEAHNGRLPGHIQKLEVQSIIDAVMMQGGTDIDSLREFAASDFVACGFPTALAGAARTMIAGAPVAAAAPAAAPASATPQTIVVRNVDIESEMADATESDLLRRYNHDKPGRVGAELSSRAKGVAFLGFGADATLDQEASLKRLQKIMKGKRVGDTMTLTNGQVVRPRHVGDVLVDEPEVRNPLFPEHALLDDMECEFTGESWEGIDRDVMKLLVVEAKRPGGRPWGSNVEAARSVITAARQSNAGIEFRRRYKDAAVALGEMQAHEREALLIAAHSAVTSTSQEAARGLPFVVESPWADARPGAMRTAIIAVQSDKKHVVDLTKHLSPQVLNGQITLWHPWMDHAGGENSMLAHIEEADSVLIMISADMLAELAPDSPALEAANRLRLRGGAVVPILTRPANFNHSKPTWWLENHTPIPHDYRAVTSWSMRDAAWSSVAESIRRVAESFAKRTAQAASKQSIVDSERTGSFFDSDTLNALYNACIEIGIEPSTMKSGLDPRYAASFRTCTSLAADIHNVLTTVNVVPSLADGSVPMRVVLQNCMQSAGARHERRIFEQCLKTLPPVATAAQQFTVNIHGSNIGALALGNGSNVSAHYNR